MTTNSQLVKATLLSLLALQKDSRSNTVSTNELFTKVREDIKDSLTENDLEALPSGARRIDQKIRNLVSNKTISDLIEVKDRQAKFTLKGRSEAFAALKEKENANKRMFQEDILKFALIALKRICAKSHRSTVKSDVLRKELLKDLEPHLYEKDKESLPSSPKRRRIDQVVNNLLSSNKVLDKLGYTVFDNMKRVFTVDRNKVTQALKAL